MDLIGKLRMHTQQPACDSQSKHMKPDEHDYEIDRLIDGQCVQNRLGSYFVYETNYDWETTYAGIGMEKIAGVCKENIDFLCQGHGFALKDAVFVDTETTGLSTGAGTRAFLVGIGRCTSQGFCVSQFFMRDFHEEPALLSDVASCLQKAEGAVSFNGKSYDLPLLESRMIANRLSFFSPKEKHLDLLHNARRFWKHSYENCKLVTLESNVLGFEREDDFPSDQIPLAYFRYLDTKDARTMVKVMEHNRLDILSLAALSTVMSDMIVPVEKAGRLDQLSGLGRLHDLHGHTDESMACVEKSLESYPLVNVHGHLTRLSAYYKRRGDYERAVSLWNLYINRYTDNLSVPLILFLYIELAKYYEHRQKDPIQAMEYVKKAREVARKAVYVDTRYTADFDRRQKRLDRKIKE